MRVLGADKALAVSPRVFLGINEPRGPLWLLFIVGSAAIKTGFQSILSHPACRIAAPLWATYDMTLWALLAFAFHIFKRRLAPYFTRLIPGYILYVYELTVITRGNMRLNWLHEADSVWSDKILMEQMSISGNFRIKFGNNMWTQLNDNTAWKSEQFRQSVALSGEERYPTVSSVVPHFSFAEVDFFFFCISVLTVNTMLCRLSKRIIFKIHNIQSLHCCGFHSANKLIQQAEEDLETFRKEKSLLKGVGSSSLQ